MNGIGDVAPRVVHVEVVQKATSRVDPAHVKTEVESFLARNVREIGVRQVAFRARDFTKDPQDAFLFAEVEAVGVQHDENAKSADSIAWGETIPKYHIFKLSDIGPQDEEMDDEESAIAATNWILPSREIHGDWDALIYDSDVKNSLLKYLETTLYFSDKGVDPRFVSWNRVILLHGPPGTGKTSLCRALAQKVMIRHSDRYKSGHLIEINSHSLFSKWFSESGKLVQKMFETIMVLVEDPKAMVCVLIDEVESLAAARKSGGNEPSDAIRVVNALLTQIDNIKRFPNVLILTTSNITGSIDLAFVDRADMKKFIGLPSKEAIYAMLKGSIEELMRTQVIHSTSDLDDVTAPKKGEESASLMLVCEKCVGFSGRAIRKIPFLAFSIAGSVKKTPTLREYIEALAIAVENERSDRTRLN